MRIYRNQSEERLLDTLRMLKDDLEQHFAVHFCLSRLQEHYKSDFQLKIAMNILNDVFRNERGYLFLARDGDIFVIYSGDDRNLIEKAIFQLRYLFVDDPLANHTDGGENPDFCSVYDLRLQWRNFHKECIERVELIKKRESKEVTPLMPKPAANALMTPSALQRIVDVLPSVEIGLAIRKQPICALKQGEQIRPVYNEIYVNMMHLKELLRAKFNLTSDPWLFRYLTNKLDGMMLEHLIRKPSLHLKESIALNLTVETVVSEEFDEFIRKSKRYMKTSMVLEIDASDVFANFSLFRQALKIAKEQGYRVCLDGLTNESFIQLDRDLLGFDLVKLRWNADTAGALDSPRNRKLREAIEKCKSNRMILCWCDSEHAIDYGHALGITLFQGRYPDKILDPDAVIIN